tara:strand:+ start:5110 stop:6627 length:1518 start_codon:yes stop_codon:yes gene_type:complete
VNGLEASQDTSLKGNVTIGDGTSFKQAIINSETIANRPVTLEDTLLVKGKTTLADIDANRGTFKDSVSFEGDLNATGNATIGGDGTSFKQAIFNANTVFNKPARVENTLDVKGKTTLKDLDVDGTFSFKNATFDTDTTFNKNVVVKQNVNVEGKTTLADVDVNGAFTFQSATFAQKPTFGDGMNVYGDVDVNGVVRASEIHTDVFSFKNGTFEVDLDCKKNVTVEGVLKADTLEVQNMRYENAVFNDETYFNQTVNAQTVRASKLELSGGFTTEGDIYTTAEISGREGYFYNLTTMGTTELRDDVNITGGLEIGKNTKLMGDLIVTGTVQTHQDANVQNINASNSITANTIQTSSNIEVRGNATFKNDVTIDNRGTFGDITVVGTAHIHELRTDIVASDTFSVDNLIVGNLVQVSDKNVKKDIETLDKRDIMAKVKELRAVSFNWKKDNSREIGFIAQEVRDVFPEFVSGTKDNSLVGVKYSNMVSVLVACIQDLQEQIDAMKTT